MAQRRAPIFGVGLGTARIPYDEGACSGGRRGNEDLSAPLPFFCTASNSVFNERPEPTDFMTGNLDGRSP